MTGSIVEVSNNPQQLPQRSISSREDIVGQIRSFSPPAGWARMHPELALKILFICPQVAPWADEILD